VMSVDHIRRRVLNLDVGRDSNVLDIPLSVQIIKSKGRRRDASAIDGHGDSERPNQPSPGSRAYQRSNFSQVEIERQRVATRACGFVDDHYLRTVYSSDR